MMRIDMVITTLRQKVSAKYWPMAPSSVRTSFYFPNAALVYRIPLVTDIRVAHVNTSAAHIQQSVENSLKNLKTDYLDVFCWII
jgi:aryl-alcohol dehydrogenase-like predicted oxidoreductase